MLNRPSDRSRAGAVLVVLLVCALASAVIWLGPGILNTRAGGDSPFLLQRVHELSANLRAGQFPARWMPDAAYGLGYPFFHFYAALPYYLAAALNQIGFDLLIAIKLTQTLGMFAAAGALALYARRWLSLPGVVLASAAYTLAPFHLVNVYVRGDSLSEFYAFVWHPLILWAVDRVARRQTMPAGLHIGAHIANTLMLALFVAALVLTHNVSAMIFAPFIVIYALVAIWRERRAPVLPLARLTLAALLAMLLSAWFWLPALGDAPLVQLGDQTTGYFHFANHFRGPDLIQPGLIFDYGASPFAMGLAQAALAVAGAVVCLARAVRARHFSPERLLWPALFAVATWMITPLSAIVWENMPLLPLAQFPWRFLSVQALFAALLAGSFVSRNTEHGIQSAEHRSQTPEHAIRDTQYAIRNTQIPNPKWVVLVLLMLLVAQSIPGLPSERLNARAEDVTPESLKLYEWFTGNIGTTIRAEYLPVTAQPRPFTGPDVLGMPRRAFALSGSVIDSALEEESPVRQVWRIHVAGDGAAFVLPLLYWPAWRARIVGGPEIELSPFVGSGWAQVSLPGGRHRIELWLDATPLQRAGEAMSLLAALVTGALAGLAAVLWARQAGWSRAGRLAARWAIVGIGAGGALVMAMLGARWLDPPGADAAPMQTLDFAGRPFPHRGPLTFVDGAGQTYTMTHALVSPARVRAGDVFTLTTQWEGGRAPAQVGVQQVLPQGGYFALLFRYAREASFGAPALSVHRALSDALPGPMPLTLVARDASGQPLTPTVAAGEHEGRAILAGLLISESRASRPDSIIRVFPNGIVLRQVDWFHTGERNVCIRLTWSTTRPRADALKVSLRLRGADGREIASADGEAQGGLAPTWAWPVDASVGDNYCVDVADTLGAGEPYTLLVRWYRLRDNHTEGEITLVGERGQGLWDLHSPALVITEHLWQPPAMQTRSEALFAGMIRLLGYDLLTTTQSLSLTLHWQAQKPIAQDYKLFVHLSPLDRADPLRQADRLTRDGLYPSGVWQPGEIVSDTVALDLAGLPPARYRLAIGWYDPNTLTRLPAMDAGRPVPEDWLMLGEIDLTGESAR